MWRFILCFIAFCFATTNLNSQQITTDNSQSLQNLIENNLVQGCVQVSNISSSVNGSVNNFSSYGYFEKAGSNFPFNYGIILSTGNINSAGNTLNDSDLNEGDTTWGTDPDLESALGISNTLNATSIQFDFRTGTDTVQFNYILASEEYLNDYPCNYSDGFAFLIKEAGTNDPYQNIALIPGTSTPVNTNTIHNEIVGFCDAENEEYFAGNNIGDTNFNGRTTVLSATTTVTPNVLYNIKLVIADQTDRNFDSAVFIQGNSFTDEVDLGPDITICDDSTILNAITNNPDATYQWFQNGTAIANETSSSLTVNTSATYQIEVTVPLNETTCTYEDEINVALNSIQNGPEITDYELCDDSSNDGIEGFNLTSKDDEVIANISFPNHTITYHLTNQDAIDNINAYNTINNTTNPQAIYIRIVDEDTGCISISTFNLVVHQYPIISDPEPVSVCDNNAVDLTASDDSITNSDSDLIVSYHYSQEDANTGANPIPSPYSSTNETETLYVRVISPFGCTAFTTIIVESNESPTVNQATQQLNACEQDEDGFEFFDLTEIIEDVLEGETNVTVTFHLTSSDAQNNINPIENPSQFENTVQELQIIYIRVENNDSSCFTIVPLELHTNILHTGTNIQDFYACDAPPDDGSADFDLNEITEDIANDLEDITITYYETQEDLDNNTNPIDSNLPYTVGNESQTLYLLIENLDCSYPTEIVLTVHPSVTVETTSVTYCDTDDDELTSIELAVFNDAFTTNISSPLFSYFETEEDAENNTNVLPPFYSNSVDPVTLYVKATNGATGCFDIAAFEIDVLPAPSTNTPTGFIICDQDQDGFEIIDLTSVIPEVISDTNGFDIAFYPSSGDANNETNEITNTTNFNTQTTTAYIKVVNQDTSCFRIEPISILINTIPLSEPISDFGSCDTNGNQTSEFILSEKDNEILNGQTDKQVLYFETENDAINNTNAIDKNNDYTNTSQTQTIYVRIENISDPNCYITSSFNLVIDDDPIFNEPNDISACDDESNDGIEAFDLNITREEIILNSPENLTVTFHLTQEDANNETNALADAFTNTENPQTLYIAINNGSYCTAYSIINYSVVQVFQLNDAPDIEVCDTDTDGFATFDLTTIEEEVLDIRPDNLQIDYFENETDLNNNTNPIQYPTNYTNITNPQTAYIQVTNSAGCSTNKPIQLIVSIPPEITPNLTFETCDTSNQVYNLNTTIPDLIDDQQNVTTTFYSTMEDAEQAQNPLNPNYNYTTNTTTIYVRANFTGSECFSIGSFTLEILALPATNSIQDLETCDSDFDGIETFDLSQQTPIVLGSQNPNDFSVTYFYNQITAVANQAPILNLNVDAEDGDTFYIRVENNTTHCFSITSFSTLVHRKPVINIPGYVICLDNLPLIVSAETGVTDDTYLWSTGETTNTIEINEIGTYTVTITSAFGCTTSGGFNITESEPATIDIVETVDFSDPNNVTITVSGIGDYLYQLDDQEPQESNFFSNVAIGPHTITVIDNNGCNSTTKNIVVIDFPKFVTPNGDGHFDTWHITGVDQLPGTVIYIFDRFGKLLTKLKDNTQGWNGKYNGYLMPASDYWFLAEVVKDGVKFEAKGHFTLRR